MKLKNSMVGIGMLVVGGLLSYIVIEPFAGRMTDIKDHWAKNEINYFTDNGFIKGYEDGTFKPNNNITRAEFVTMFNSVFNTDTIAVPKFTDVPQSHWAFSEIGRAVASGVCQGTSATTFEPDRFITREEASKMLANYLNISDNNIDKANKFTDFNSISSWAVQEVEGCVEKGYIVGYEDNSFKPNGYITRAETVVMLNRAIDGYKTPTMPDNIQAPVSFETFKEILPALGFEYDGVRDYYIENQNSLLVCLPIALNSYDVIGFQLYGNLNEISDKTKECFNLIFKTEGDNLLNTVIENHKNGITFYHLKIENKFIEVIESEGFIEVAINFR